MSQRDLSTIDQGGPPVVEIEFLTQALVSAADPSTVRQIEGQLERAEAMMRASGLYRIDEIRPVNELRMRARWKLGQLLAEIERGHGPGRGKKMLSSLTSFRDYLRQIKLTPPTALEAQRIGTLPEPELERAFAAAHREDILNTFSDLIDRARPWWYQASRKQKHLTILAKAKSSAAPLGPFPLILADPPWKFETYSEKGLERTPDQHYPTLTDEEIVNFKVGNILVRNIAAPAAVLFLWCTSANVRRALAVMDGWGFSYRTNCVWMKDRGGLGLVFRNWHEHLLYGIRGAMPGPQYQPASVFQYPRGEHSAKPPEIRAEIEKMYPDFDAATRLELFARETLPGWTPYGLEIDRDAA
jgi:N6-adenosine-specific RNA methylase IME4